MSARPDVAWLAGLRWFGGADRRVDAVDVRRREPITPQLDWLLLDVSFEGGTIAQYQVFWDGSGDRVDEAAALRWLFPELFAQPPATVALLGGEMTNTSMVVDGDVIVKVFRRLTPERNPDVDVVRRLWDAGFGSVPEPLAESVRELRLGPVDPPGDPTPTDLAVARRFLVGAVDGWKLATSAPRDFLAETAELGRVTAELHLALAATYGTRPADPASWAEAMRRQLGRTSTGDAHEAVEERYARLARQRGGGSAIRVHGDYHLGQVLRHDDRWYVLDFEGEPGRPVAERIAPASPLKDVAGMLRSFGYAAALADAPEGWEADARRGFLDAYLATSGVAELLPATFDDVLACFELDKVVYELAYERANRPSWDWIPLRALQRLLGS